MRARFAAAALCAGLLLAACGGGGEQAGNPITTGVAPFALPSVSPTAVGEEPTIVSRTAPPTETTLEVLTEGGGPPVGPDDVIVAGVKGQVWDLGGVELPGFVNSFSTGVPAIEHIADVVPAWEKKLPGVPVGSRVLLIAPPADGFGAQGNQGVGIFPGDTLMFVIDVLDAVDSEAAAKGTAVALADPGLPTVTGAKNPKIRVPDADPPARFVDRLLIRGDGEEVTADRAVLVQYTGVIWRTGKVFDTTWTPGREPFDTFLGTPPAETGIFPAFDGWTRGLVGEQVGSRVLLVLPPEEAYGEMGNEEAGIRPTDTVVFVLDILGVYGTELAAD